MKKLILVFLLILFPLCIYSQWIDQSVSSIPFITFTQSKFLNSSTGFLSGYTKVLKTTNGGINWVFTTPNPQSSVRGMDFKDENTGMVVGGYSSFKLCYKTTDGGNNWTQVNFPNSKGFYNIKFLNPNVVICSGDSGLVIKSSNLGANWTVIQTPTIEGLGSIFVVDSLRCFIAGANGVFLRSSDGGVNWDLLFLGTSVYFGSIYFINSNTGYAGSSTSLLKKTTNGGLFWTTLNTGSPFVTEVSSIFFPSVNTGYLTSFYDTGMGYQEVILKTVNAGANWANVTTTHRIAPLRTSYFVSNDTGWVAGDGNFILKTTNGGLTFVSGNSEIVQDFSLSQNYPNPFNPSTKFNYELRIANYIEINLYDASGKLIKVLQNGFKRVGNYEVNFSAENLSSGIYYYTLYADEVLRDTKKAVVIK